MSITCQECSYVMTKSELSGYLFSQLYTFIKTIILPYAFARNKKKNITQNIESFLIGILNDQKVVCHVCHKYAGWSNINLKSNNNIRNYTFIAKLKNLPFVEKVILFGSRARGTNQPRSDIDLAIVCPDIASEQWQEILDIVENADTLLKIDCLQFEKTDADLKQRILKDGIEL